MPKYEYACKSCAEHIEVVQTFAEATLTECPACGGELRKVFSPPSIAFKGSGFYRTDNRKRRQEPSSEKSDAKVDAKSDANSDSNTDAKSSDTKTDTKTDTKSEPVKAESKPSSESKPKAAEAKSA